MSMPSLPSLSFFGSWSGTPTTKTLPLPPKVSLDEPVLPLHAESWESVDGTVSPTAQPRSASSIDDHDGDFVDVRDGGEDDHHPTILHNSQRDSLPRRQPSAHPARAPQQPKTDSHRKAYQGKAQAPREQSRSSTNIFRRETHDAEVDAVLKEENDGLKAAVRRQTEETERLRKNFREECERLNAEKAASQRRFNDEIERLRSTLQQNVRQVEVVTVERDRIRRDRDGIVASLTAENERHKVTLAKQADEFKAALEEMNRDRSQAHSDLHKLRKTLDNYSARLEGSLAHSENLLKENKELRAKVKQIPDLIRQREALARDIEVAREESSTLRKEYGQMTALLDDRTSELKGAQSFLTTADTFSGTEVLNTLQRLNSEVLQHTAFIAESMIESYMPDKALMKTEKQMAGANRVSGVIGRTIVHFLGTKKHRDDPILVQIAFQAYFAHVLQWIACAWSIGGDETQNQLIDEIYEKVRDTEAQAISGRWRALTRGNMPRKQRDEPQLTSLLTTKILSGLVDILLAAGCNASQAELVTALSSKFGDKISFLVTLAVRVNKIVGEDVTSGDLEVLAVPPASLFDPASMEDVYNEASSGTGARVLCTTDLGLRKRVRVFMTGEKEKQWALTTLLKPKVALESVVEIMDD